MQTASSKIKTWVAESISFDNNRYGYSVYVYE